MNKPSPDLYTVRVDAQTAFVLGNGPSLADVSLPALNAYASIGMNAAYRYWREIDWRPRYYACVDTVVGLSHKDEIAALIEEGRIERFLLRNNLIEALGRAARSSRIVNFDAVRGEHTLLDVNPPTTGSHSALWAAEMGYTKIVILGVDAQYKEIVEGARRGKGIELEIVEARDNPNYFFKGYQAPGDKYNVPNPHPDSHVRAWRRASENLREADVEIYNGNINSGVRCLPFIALEPFLNDGAAPTPPDETIAFWDNDAASMQTSPKARIRQFVAAHALGAAAALAAAALALVAWAGILSPSLAVMALAGAGLGAVFFLVMAFLYARFVILAQLARQDAEFTALRAKFTDLERLRNHEPKLRQDKTSPAPAGGPEGNRID